jgi:DNA-binding XRE family transcriptional regulator
MAHRTSRAGKATQGSPVWPERVIVAGYRAASGELSLGFEGGRVVHVPLRRLGLPAGSPFVFAAPDEFGSGVVLFREDGSCIDCGVDWVLRKIAADAEGNGDEPTAGSDLARRVAARLKAFRERSGATQREMACRLGMAPPNYHRLESGRHQPSTDTLLSIAEIMGVSLGQLVKE